jgi:hypothetical protein
VGKGRLREGALRPGGRCAPASTSGRGARWPRIPPRDSFSPTAPPLDAGRETSGDAPKRLCSEANDAGSTQDGPALLCPALHDIFVAGAQQAVHGAPMSATATTQIRGFCKLGSASEDEPLSTTMTRVADRLRSKTQECTRIGKSLPQGSPTTPLTATSMFEQTRMKSAC